MQNPTFPKFELQTDAKMPAEQAACLRLLIRGQKKYDQPAVSCLLDSITKGYLTRERIERLRPLPYAHCILAAIQLRISHHNFHHINITPFIGISLDQLITDIEYLFFLYLSIFFKILIKR
jgi:hypothetical protein